jgi:hypothetical protein
MERNEQASLAQLVERVNSGNVTLKVRTVILKITQRRGKASCSSRLMGSLLLSFFPNHHFDLFEPW